MRAGFAAVLLMATGLATGPTGAAMADAPLMSPVPPARPAIAGQPQSTADVGNAPASSPMPRPRPAALVAPLVEPVVAQATSGLAPAASPLPRERPRLPEVARLATPDMMAMALPTRSAPLRSLIPQERPEGSEQIVLTSAPVKKKTKASRKGSVCGNPAIKGAEIAVIKASVKGCGLSDGVNVTSVSGVALSSPAQLDCATAEALNSWVEGALIPAVGTTGGGVERIQIAASYTCRPRNNQKGNRISEHGKGRAIDVSGIVLENGKQISVLADWGKGRGGKILKAARQAACGPFTTVLGPGADRFHRDHLHLDTARGRGPYCR